MAAVARLKTKPTTSNHMKSCIHTSIIAAVAAITLNLHAAHPPGPVGHFEPVGRFKPAAPCEAITATADGKLLIYTNPEDNEIGFIDISDPAAPTETPGLPVGGVPTSVAVLHARWAIAVVAEGYDPLANAYSGSAVVIDLNDPAGPSVARTIPLGGQPDSIAVSPDGRYAAISIENERLGALGVTPAGFLAVLDLTGAPAQWTARNVSLTGLASIFPNDPEPEYVAINHANQAAVTLQENNHVVVVDLPSGAVVSHFSAGQVVNQLADLTNNGVVSFTQSHTANREPDAIAWTPNGNIVIANEGDLTSKAGGRNITIFSPAGVVVFDPGASLETLANAAGLYRDNRSAARGAEFNTVRVAEYANHTYLFASSEKMDFVAVYRLTGDDAAPQFVQFLRTGDEPEGMVAIPNRRLLVTANEDDDTIDIFAGKPGNP
jgi:DNA-binding beta-propeller fold protein YncE